MKYKIEDINFDEISPREFENLCYDLIVQYNFSNLVWREGGADSGRDIEAFFTFTNSISDFKTKWFFECKRYAKGVPPDELTSKIAWADAERPKYLVFFISSYLTNPARTWLEKIQEQKDYQIIIIEGEELKNRIVKYPDLVERYFSQNKHKNLFKSIKDFKAKFNINPSYEILKEIIENIDFSKLDNNDFGFLLFSFYDQYLIFESRNDTIGDFDDTIINKLLSYIKANVSNEKLESFETYKHDFDDLAGTGFIDEMFYLYEDDYEEDLKYYNFQFYHLHLNPSKSQDNWKIGLYAFIIFEDIVIELFNENNTEIRIIKDFSSKKIELMLANRPKITVKDFELYLKVAVA